MTYIGVKTKYRSSTFAAALLMAFGLVLIMLSLYFINTFVNLIAISLLAPTCMSITFHQA